MAHVARGRANEAAHRMLLHVLRHVQADHLVLAIEEFCRQSLCQLGLPDSRGPGEEEGACGLVPARELGSAAEHGAGNGGGGLLLAHHSLVQCLLEVEQPGLLALRQLRHWDAGPASDDLCDVHGRDGLAQQRRVAVLVELLLALLQLPDAMLHPRDGFVAQVRRSVHVMARLHEVQLPLQVLQLGLRLAQVIDELPLLLVPGP
mmetsp:Transcript_74056/g.176575  ORF Transcript_74056/g.176575 Transcript_74056/m.176575 type:complete len:204 (+) Transcript_74056:668-1279(+)